VNPSGFTAIRRVGRTAWRDGELCTGERAIPEEAAIALTYNSVTHAVMMATPADLEDFAVGFSLTEGVIDAPDEIEGLELVRSENGIELRMWIAEPRGDAFTERRRHLAGPTGCGLCGIESLAEAMRQPPIVTSDFGIAAETVRAAIAALPAAQTLKPQHSGNQSMALLPCARMSAGTTRSTSSVAHWLKRRFRQRAALFC
jgi:FdhD protein